MAPFDYYDSNEPARLPDSLAGRCGEALDVEMQERIELLYRLGFSKDQTIQRLTANIGWEFDNTWTKGIPGIAAKIKKSATDYYKKMAGKKD